MFKIATSETYTAPVVVELPGSATKQTFDIEFKRLSQSGINNLFGRVKDGDLDDAGFCRQIVAGWKGVSDENGAVEFSEGALDALLDIYPLSACIVNAYSQSLAGAKLKN